MADEPLPEDSRSEKREEPTHDSGYDHPAEYDAPSTPVAPEPLPEEDDEGGPVKSFLEHLEDLRWVLIKIVASVLVSMTICTVAAKHIITLLEIPKNATKLGSAVELTWLDPMGPFKTWMKMAFWGGVALAIPFILFFIGQFVMPALKKNEKPYFRKAFIIGGGLFFVGILVCYGWVLPIGISGVIQIADWLGPRISQWRADEYFQFVIMFMLGMGLSFEIPVILLTLVKMGLISHQTLAKGRVYFFIGNMVLCAMITPDALSTVFMVVPVQILLEICIQISAHWERQKRIAEAKAAKA